jgi:hypothetical protein
VLQEHARSELQSIVPGRLNKQTLSEHMLPHLTPEKLERNDIQNPLIRYNLFGNQPS